MSKSPSLRVRRAFSVNVRSTPAITGTMLLACLQSCAIEAQQARLDSRNEAPPAANRLSIDVLYDPVLKVDFNGKPPTSLAWLDDTHYLSTDIDPKTKKSERFKVEAATGKREILEDVAPIAAALVKAAGLSAEEAERIARKAPAAITKGRETRAYSIGGDVYVYSSVKRDAFRVTSTPEEEGELDLSPDGRWVSFVRANDLYAVQDSDPRTEHRFTQDGSELILNGKLDWLYQEEIYGRGNFRGYWWSEDSSSIAFLRLDQTRVPKFTLVDDIPHALDVEVSPYPRPGDPNPTVRLGTAAVRSGTVAWVDLAKYGAQEILITDVAWSPAGTLHFQVQDREQTWLDLNGVTPFADQSPSVLIHETTPAWVEPLGSPQWLADGSFLWFSQRAGFKHLYHYRSDGTLIRQITSGDWEARTLHGVDEKTGWVYFSGTERSPVGSDVYRIKLDGSGLVRLSTAPGTHTAKFNPGFTAYIDSWSDVSTPTQVRVHAADGRELAVIDANPVPALRDYPFSKPELMQVKTRDGFVMEAMLILPMDFDPTQRYPVFQHTYAGPHSPQVRNAWLGTNGMFFQLLAQEGVIVWVCDNRTASGKGAESEWPAYKRLGETELPDIEDGIAWLKEQRYVDGERIGIGGWSYGGFMTAYALTHSKTFAMGIAGGSVTDWRNYDSIYTERYMLTPEHNAAGYDRTSVLKAAANLSGKLLLIHGALDDNVHPQNTMQLAYELQKAGKPFELMLYPKSRHGVSDPLLVKHYRAAMLEFIRETLQTPDV